MELKDFFIEYNKVALAYSGGVDSAFLLYAGLKYGADIKAYYVRSAFQPEFEYRDAMRMAENLGANVQIIKLDILQHGDVTENTALRCYFCKQKIMGSIISAAAADGYDTLLDGTNASDDAGDRPGMAALRELNILSPLRICNLTKPEIRRLSREAGLFTWDKPAYACLATRVPVGERISGEKLKKVERGEDFLFKLGFRDFRLRLRAENALLQFTRKDMAKAESMLEEIRVELSDDFAQISIDPVRRRDSI